MTKRFFLLLLLIGGLFGTAVVINRSGVASAHQSGCHRWHSCPSDSGSYACGDLGYYSGCPGGAPTTQTQTIPPPHVPVVTKKTITDDEALPFAKVTVSNWKEYAPYSKVVQEGAEGTKRSYREITYKDGVETSRAFVRSEAIVQPKNQIIEVGKRYKPLAKVTRFWSTSKKDRYDVKGTFKAGTEVVLGVGSKKVMRAKTNEKGEFLFKGVKITAKEAVLTIYERINQKENQVSEKTFADKKTKAILTEYDSFR